MVALFKKLGVAFHNPKPLLWQCCRWGMISGLALGPLPVQACLGIQGQEYTDLPADFCQGYADALLGKQGPYEYGVVVCDRTEGSYFFLQRLVRYTDQQRAVWKVVQIKPLSKLRPNELALSQGCQQVDQNRAGILAVVREQANRLTTHRAWAIDFATEALISLDPTTVNCEPELQPELVP
ncbi:hypothetical protein [Acaryochloris sp. IP29b_bin.137]|uniref:hypothetical protein n=1 Tax=Acaryochloris sp. IP29b_bin.137 TaxID=2969217 RepID=UPI002619C518|nr:hypothetical protein [Acaryochloris sp. IP29b_bin.137]